MPSPELNFYPLEKKKQDKLMLGLRPGLKGIITVYGKQY